MTNRSRLIGVLLSVAVGGTTILGCGGSDEPTRDSSSPAATSTVTAPAATDSTPTASADGAAVFATNCASCHTLEAADSSGTFGPNLDDLKPASARVVSKVTQGGGGMPAFGDQLSGKEIQAVAAYVSENAGN